MELTKSKEVVISIDVGGMSYKAGLVDREGNILTTKKVEAVPYGDAELFASALCLLTRDMKGLAEEKGLTVKAIGLSLPGVIDDDAGMLRYANNLILENVHLRDEFNKMYPDIPVYMLNDANAATLGEARKGIASKFKNVIFLTIGTGIGGGIIVDGKLYAGIGMTGAELGHMSIDIGGKECTCGRKGCFEAYASATALISYIEEALKKYPDTKMRLLVEDRERPGGHVPFETLKKYPDDEGAKECVDTYVAYLSEGILNYCNIFRPDAIILGGGVSAQGEYLTNLVDEYCAKRHYGYTNTPAPKILTAELKNDAGMIGAAFYAFEKLN